MVTKSLEKKYYFLDYWINLYKNYNIIARVTKSLEKKYRLLDKSI